jgi:hypothetical protein
MPILRQMRRSSAIRRVAADAGGVGTDQRFAFDRDGAGIDGFEMVEAAQEGALARP